MPPNKKAKTKKSTKKSTKKKRLAVRINGTQEIRSASASKVAEFGDVTAALLDITRDQPPSRRTALRYIHPSTLIGIERNKTFVIGPACIAEVDGTDKASVRAALIASGAVRRVSARKYRQLSREYRGALTSRTAAFVDAISPTAASGLAAIQRIRRMSVVIIGCGGIGSGVAYLLASLGAKKIVLIDGDNVELSNLNRQFLFTRADVGKLKVHALRDSLLARFQHAPIVAIPVEYPNPRARVYLKRASHVVCVGDSPPDLFAVVAQDLRRRTHLWSAGYIMGASVIRYGFRRVRSDLINWLTSETYFAPSVGFQNMEIAAELVGRMTVLPPPIRRRQWMSSRYRAQ